MSEACVRSGLGVLQWCGVSADASPGLRAPSRRPAPLLSPTSPLELPVGPQGCDRWALCLSFRLGRGGPRCRAGSVSTAAWALLLGLGEALEPTSNLFSLWLPRAVPFGVLQFGGVWFFLLVSHGRLFRHKRSREAGLRPVWNVAKALLVHSPQPRKPRG